MAVSVKSFRLSNPAKKKRVASKTGKKRKLSPKQIAIFGTPRQKAALRASRSRKRNAGVGSMRKHKKQLDKRFGSGTGKWFGSSVKRGRKALKAKTKRKKNVGEIVSISLAGLAGNPGRRRNTGMAKRRVKKSKAAVAARRRYRASRRVNSGVVRRKRTGHRTRMVARRRTRRSNPMFRVRRVHRRRNAGVISSGGGIVMKAASVIGGAIGSKYLTQLVLGGNNSGVVGYVGNAVASVALGYAANKLTKKKEIGTNVMIGGFAALLIRVIGDNTTYGQYLNTALSGAGKGGDLGLGIIQDSSFFTPQVATPGSMTNFVTPRQTRMAISAAQAQTAQMASAASKGMGTVFGRPKRAVM